MLEVRSRANCFEEGRRPLEVLSGLLALAGRDPVAGPLLVELRLGEAVAELARELKRALVALELHVAGAGSRSGALEEHRVDTR